MPFGEEKDDLRGVTGQGESVSEAVGVVGAMCWLEGEASGVASACEAEVPRAAGGNCAAALLEPALCSWTASAVKAQNSMLGNQHQARLQMPLIQ